MIVPHALRSEDSASRLTPAFYYGWAMLILAALAMTATLPGRTHGLGLIANHAYSAPYEDLRLKRP